ncbi:hypothetical protein TCON_0577 [Astathelohania contejeani]|uniref:Uncharacterized protein n=1 Tax=Astathelohania contejeani TaxID=164912 RepID=A0ABQ7I1G5_9MICR|nr:hypothetical protein TCON_0577 [Thelohania contejeani]
MITNKTPKLIQYRIHITKSIQHQPCAVYKYYIYHKLHPFDLKNLESSYTSFHPNEQQILHNIRRHAAINIKKMLYKRKKQIRIEVLFDHFNEMMENYSECVKKRDFDNIFVLKEVIDEIQKEIVNNKNYI